MPAAPCPPGSPLLPTPRHRAPGASLQREDRARISVPAARLPHASRFPVPSPTRGCSPPAAGSLTCCAQSLRPPAQGICSFFPSRCLCQVVPTLLLCCQRGTQPAVCLSIHPQQCAPPCHPSAKPEDAWGTEGPRGGHGHWPCCHQEEVTKLVQESLPSASWGPHMLFKAGRGEIACHQPPCRLATSLPGCQ